MAAAVSASARFSRLARRRAGRSLAALSPPPSMTSDARPATGWSSIRQSRGPLLAAATLLICLLLALHRGWTEPAGGPAEYECTNAEDELRGLSRHGRRRRRREVLTQVDLLPDQMARLQKARSREAGRAVEAMQSTLRLARCIVRWPAELEQVERVAVQLRRTRLKLGLAVGNSTRRRRRLAAVGQTTKRLTRGLSKFAGDDFACDERDMYRDAPWARDACLLSCARPRCARAVALCERLPHCAGVDVNVEGTVATLKRESELSRRTSRLRPEVTVTRVHQLHPSAAADVPCGLDDNGVAVDPVAVASCPCCCVLDCPRLDCTRAIGLCFNRPTCSGVEIGFGLAGRAAVARLRGSLSAS